MAAGYLTNRSPNRSLVWKTPIGSLQEYYGVPNPKPNLAHLQAFGCRAYPHIQNAPKLDKIEPRAHIGYLVGYDSTNIFRIWIPSQEKVISTRDVTFDERKRYDPSIESQESPIPVEIVDTIEIPQIQELDDTNEAREDENLDTGTYQSGQSDEISDETETTSQQHSIGEKPSVIDYQDPILVQQPTPDATPEPQLSENQSENPTNRQEAPRPPRNMGLDLDERHIIQGSR